MKGMKTGVFGGTFDPVHSGHVALCRQAEKEAGLDRVFVVPARLQPFKLDQRTADGHHRMEMLRLAFSEDPRVTVSDAELEREEISYTIHTLRVFQHRFPEDEISFILGADSFLKIEGWREYRELAAKHPLLVGVRPGSPMEELRALILRLESECGASVRLLANEQMAIASSRLKELLRQGASVRGWMPESVERYIEKHALYT